MFNESLLLKYDQIYYIIHKIVYREIQLVYFQIEKFNLIRNIPIKTVLNIGGKILMLVNIIF